GDGRLLWHRQVPSDQSEVPGGCMNIDESTAVRRLGEERGLSGATMAPLRDSQAQPAEGQFPFVVQRAEGEVNRSLVLSASTEAEREDWVDAIRGVIRAKTPEDVYAVTEEAYQRAEQVRADTFSRLRTEPSKTLASPEHVYSLLVGCEGGGGGGITRKVFVKYGGQHLLPLCDTYTAGAVFDALCPRPPTADDPAGGSTGAEGLEELLSLMGEGLGGGNSERTDGVRTNRVPAEPLDCGF
ncbi:unnamed protein product, partial [Discosporangium mesarthrocarpum]